MEIFNFESNVALQIKWSALYVQSQSLGGVNRFFYVPLLPSPPPPALMKVTSQLPLIEIIKDLMIESSELIILSTLECFFKVEIAPFF